MVFTRKMIKSSQYNVLIIGAGKMGAFYDFPKSKNILTHAHAFSQHRGFKLLGFVDVNRKKAERTALIWGGKAFSSIDEAFTKEKSDLAVVAVPDQYHYQVLKKISQFPLRLVYTEKPLVETIKDAKDILKLYKEKNIPLLVNYTRRFIPEFEKIKRNIEEGEYGAFITGTGYYGKGLLHNGSHLIDLLRWFLGEIESFQIIDSFNDFNHDDPSVAAVLNLKDKKPFFLQIVNSRLYTIFEMDFLFEKKRVLIKDGGFRIEEYEVQKDKVFKGYKKLVRVKEAKTAAGKAMFYALDNIYEFLSQGKKLKSSLKDAYQTTKVCLEILSQSLHE